MGSRQTCWVLSNGIIGMDNQSLGLAHALGLEVVKKTMVASAPWKYLPPQLWLAPLRFLGAGSDAFVPPWPDVVIGTGRLNIALSIAIKRASGGRCFNIRIQNPHVVQRHFDVIVAPLHDQCKGANVIETLGAVNSVTTARLNAAATQFSARLAQLPRPLIGVLIGGTNRSYTLDAAFAAKLADKLIAAVRNSGGSVVLTPSRRTAPEALAVLKQRLAAVPSMVWDGNGDNPYTAYLALADYLVVTADSVNMASEACFTGKPVFVEGLTGGSSKFEQFHRTLQQRGYTRPFTGELADWTYPPLDETARVAHLIKQRMDIKI
ncbi:mitochondrial fission ELM1 family protein [Sulfuriferula sp.]|uniref:mitochondrial fission ELM1 family protein n=1 Tax=Sulfuriferula sp. TaxID=2025307 RepID=UPI002730F508|nr:mitochondrial fission ELM1 family protein [Sulfuriferula sp.]MDP2026503.1 mitochondrial fission ELM1 family protein [Sulfuriferula sp.]